MKWFKQIICGHDWEVYHSSFWPPTGRSFQYAYQAELDRFLHGYTVRYFNCNKCGKQAEDYVLGKWDKKTRRETRENP